MAQDVVEVGIIADMHGVFGPEPLLSFLQGVDELWMAGDIGTRENYYNWARMAPVVRAVRSTEDLESSLDSRAVPWTLAMKACGMRILLTHCGRESSRSGYAFCDEECLRSVQSFRPDILVCGFTHEAAAFVDDKTFAWPVFYLNPGAVSPLLEGDRTTALRLRLTPDGVSDVRLFDVECPEAWMRRGADVVSTRIFIDGCVVSGKYAAFSNRKVV